MKIALRYMGKHHRFREKPQIVSICRNLHIDKEVSNCACISALPPRMRSHILNIPFGKRYFECDPCKPKCNLLIAETNSVQQLRDLWRSQCCSEYK